MRLSRITCCTVTALLGSGVAAQANEGINEHQPNNTNLDQPDLNYAHPSDKYQVAAVVLPATVSRIVPPETSLNHVESRQSHLELANADLDGVAIAPTNQSSEFVSEFEWTTEPPVTAEQSTAPSQVEQVSMEEPQTDQQIDQRLFGHNPSVDPRILARPLATAGDEATTGAIAKLPDEIPAITNEPGNATVNEEIPPTDSSYLISQNSRQIQCEDCSPIEPLVLPEVSQGVSPALSIAIPVGFGADQNTLFLSSSYQAVTRIDGYSTFHSGLGVGLGNASDTVGVELSYTLDTDDEFGDGGFNAKLHKRFSPDFAGAIGWNGFLNTSRHDFEHSLYGSLTKVFRTRESLDQPFSRIAITAGVGTNQFRSDAAVRAGNNDVNAFGNIAVRVARPVSFITEWSGQDLGIGLSIAPFENIPLVITPAIRDIFDGHGSRFVLGIGLAKKF